MKNENLRLISSIVIFFLVFCIVPFLVLFFLKQIDIGWLILYFIVIFPLLFLGFLFYGKFNLKKFMRYKVFLFVSWTLFLLAYISSGLLFYFGFSMSFAL
jgi:hypothetical protein